MSTKIAIVIQTNIADDMAGVYRGLSTTAEFAEVDDDVVVVFDGSGVDSLAAISTKDHKLHGMLEGLRDHVLGACGFCAKSHGVEDAVVEGGWKLLDDYKGHASLRNLVVEGRQIITF